MAAPYDAARTRALLLDIEGTTTPVDFVYGTLFPFATAHVEEFLLTHAADLECLHLLEELRRHYDTVLRQSPGLPSWHDATAEERAVSAAVCVRWLVERDSKITPLKSLQGKIWEAGYRSGKLLGKVYPDVPRAVARWRAQGRRIAIYSSGSVLAQQLLFRYSSAGDLSGFLDAYFDTTTGPKREAESYRRIAAALGLSGESILFLSDVTAELDAARAAGLQTALSLRPGTTPPEASSYPIIRTFDEILS